MPRYQVRRTGNGLVVATAPSSASTPAATSTPTATATASSVPAAPRSFYFFAPPLAAFPVTLLLKIA